MLENVPAVEAKKPTVLFVATPMYGGLCTGGYTMGILNCTQVFMQHQTKMYYSDMQNESLITRARDSLANGFLDTKECTHLMFIDSDIGFNPQDIIPMVQADKDIVVGLYPKKEINWAQVSEAVKQGVQPQALGNYTGVFVMNAVNGEDKVEVKLQEPVEIANGGTGYVN